MKTYWITTVLLMSISALGASYSYQGNGSNPNDWFDDDNWSNAPGSTNWPTAADNAMFQSTKGMTVDQTVPAHNQMQVGRGAANTVTLAAGCVMTNLNQTVVGILDNGEGNLVVDGGTLITKALRLNVGNTMLSPGSRFELKSGTVHIDSSFGGANAGDIDLGLNESATMEISGGMLTVDNNLDFTAGLLKVAGTSGTIQIGNALHLGTDTNSSTQLSFKLDESGSVSTVFADALSLEGDTVLEVDASLASDSTDLDLVLIDLGSETFSAAEFSALSNALVAGEIPNAELSLSPGGNQLLFSGTVEGTRIVSTSVDGDWLKMELQTSGSAEELFLVGSTNLTADWHSIAYATNNAGEGLMANLAQAPLEGNNRVVYVPASEEQAFFGIESAPLDDWFTVVAETDPALTTDVISSGGLELGVSSFGGGYINRLSLPGFGDVMGFQADRYGRGGQSAIRDLLHGERYNPTQAGFSDPAGTICRVLETIDESALVVAPRPCVLFRGDGQFDFTEWENLANDNYVESGGSNDWDTIDESLLPGKQATEVTSEFDYFCTYEDLMDATNITISCFRHYYEYRYIRDPGHCLQQHNLGPLFDPVTGEVTDISVAQPAGVYPAGTNDMGILKFGMSIRMDNAVWQPTHHWHVDGSTINDLSVKERGDSVTARRWHRDTSLATRTPGFTLPGYLQVHAPLLILSDSTDVDQGGALGLYFPDSDINLNSIVGMDKESGEIVYKDDRRLHMEVRDSPFRIPTMSWIGFRGHLLGMLNPTRTPPGTMEVFRGEFYILYGSPREIFEHAQLIQPF